MPGPEEGWGSGPSVPTEGWGDAAPATAPVARPIRKDPPRREDDEDAAKQVDGMATKVLAGKKKLATLRSQMTEIDTKRAALEPQINELMPELQALRAQKGTAMGQIQAGRLPQYWMEKAKELNVRRRYAPARAQGSPPSVASGERVHAPLRKRHFPFAHLAAQESAERLHERGRAQPRAQGARALDEPRLPHPQAREGGPRADARAEKGQANDRGVRGGAEAAGRGARAALGAAG